MHANYVRPGGVAFDMPIGLMDDIYDWAVKVSIFVRETNALRLVPRKN